MGLYPVPSGGVSRAAPAVRAAGDTPTMSVSAARLAPVYSRRAVPLPPVRPAADTAAHEARRAPSDPAPASAAAGDYGQLGQSASAAVEEVCWWTGQKLGIMTYGLCGFRVQPFNPITSGGGRIAPLCFFLICTKNRLR